MEGHDALKAIIVSPHMKESAGLVDVPRFVPKSNEALMRIQKLGIDGTDREINQGIYGEPPEGFEYLIMGHEALGNIEELGSDVAGYAKGQLVIPTVRRGDDCLNCSNGESDMCIKGDYREHGIYKLHGFASEYAISDANYLVAIPDDLRDVAVLLEPLSIAEKAVYQIRKIQERMIWEPKKALVLGAGSLGLLATLLLQLEGLDVSTVARRPTDSLKAKIVDWAHANYVNAIDTPVASLKEKFDIIIEATGSVQVATDSIELLNRNGVMCFLGVYSSKIVSLDFGTLLKNAVLGNRLFLGSVNANRRYFISGLEHMAQMKNRFSGVLEKMITSTLSPEDYSKALHPSSDEIKTIIQFS